METANEPTAMIPPITLTPSMTSPAMSILVPGTRRFFWSAGGSGGGGPGVGFSYDTRLLDLDDIRHCARSICGLQLKFPRSSALCPSHEDDDLTHQIIIDFDSPPMQVPTTALMRHR